MLDTEKSLFHIERLNEAWKKTKITWYPIPIGIGIAFIAFQHMLRVYDREKRRELDTQAEFRPVIIGPLQVYNNSLIFKHFINLIPSNVNSVCRCT
jgi:hypothetical protein